MEDLPLIASNSKPNDKYAYSCQVMSIGKVVISLESKSAILVEKIANWFKRAFFVIDIKDDRDSRQTPIRFQINTNSQIDMLFANAEELCSSPSWRLFRKHHNVYLQFDNIVCHLDLASCEVEIQLDENWWQEPIKDQQTPWLVSLAWMFRERRIYTLHASAVVKNGHGLLIAGDSGSGKSSTALALVLNGWSYLADDAVLLQQDKHGNLNFVALAKGFAFHPELAKCLSGVTGQIVADKFFADIEPFFPGRQIYCCRPASLLFPQVVKDKPSLVRPLSKTEALMALLPASGGILADDNMHPKREHLSVLGNLVAQTSAYQLLAGHDIFGNGAKLEALLAEHTDQFNLVSGAQ